MSKLVDYARSAKVDIVLLGAAFVWGASYLAAKQLTEAGSLWGMMALRFGAAAAILALIRAFKPVKFTKADIWVGSAVGLGLATVMTVETNGIHLTSATNAGLIISLSIIFTPIIEGWVRKFWLPKNFFVAAAGAVVGVAFLVSGNGLQSPNWGDALMFGAAVLRAYYQVVQGSLTAGRKLTTINLTIFQTLTAGVIFFIVDAPGTVRAAANYGANEWLLLSFLVLLCTVYGFFAMMWGIRRTSASRIALLQGTEPVWAVFIAMLFGGEQLNWVGGLGALLIIGSCYWGLGIEQTARQKRLSDSATGVASVAESHN
jgi:drug/metabolite transporter (DMT)-like permease